MKPQKPSKAVLRELESGYDDPKAFNVLHNSGWAHTPSGMASVREDHRGDCHCESGGGEIWTQNDTATKWSGP